MPKKDESQRYKLVKKRIINESWMIQKISSEGHRIPKDKVPREFYYKISLEAACD